MIKINKKISVGVMLLVCMFTLGCSNVNDKSKEEDSSNKGNVEEVNSSKITMEDSVSEVKEKMYNACIYDNNDDHIKTMDESKKYVENILPEEAKELEMEFIEDKGSTYAKYGSEDFVFYVCYIHPYEPTENNSDNYDLTSTSGITFPRLEINSNWESSN